MPLLGRGHFSDTQVERWHLAHRPAEKRQPVPQRLAEGWRQVVADWRYGFVLLPLGLVAAGLGFRRPEVLALALMLAALVAFWLALTHLQSRFFVLGVPLAAMLLATVRWKPWPIVGAGLFAVLGAWGWVAAYRPVGVYVRAGVPGIDSPDLLWALVVPDEGLASRAAGAERVVLIGDARAFLYPVEMRRLRYRTVFDVNARDGAGVVDAWRGTDTPVPGELVLVDPNELSRFSSKVGEGGYLGIPPLSPALRDRAGTFVLDPETPRE